MQCLSNFSGCGWAHGFTFTSLPPQTLPQIYKLAEILPDTSVQTMPIQFDWGCRTFQTASHVHGILIWGVWVPSQVVDGHMATHSLCYNHRCFPRFVKAAEILPYARMQTMPPHFGWGCRTFQTASHVHVIHTWSVWAPSQVVDVHMASQSHYYLNRHFPKFVKVGWDPTWCKCANHATTLCLRL